MFGFASLCSVLLLAACAEDDTGVQLETDTLETDTAAVGMDATNNIYAVLQDEGRFSQFIAAVDSAGLDQTLSGPGPYTVFAPTNDAFRTAQAGLDTLLQSENLDQLRGTLLYHIASGETRAQDFQDGTSIQTLEGSDLSVTGTGEELEVGGARLVETNLEAGNGVIHVVNRVLGPDSDAEGV